MMATRTISPAAPAAAAFASYFSAPQNNAAVQRSWEHFLGGGLSTSQPTLRELVEGAWQRCRDLQVAPRGVRAPVQLDSCTLSELHQQHATLLVITVTRSNLTQAAKTLGIAKSPLYQKIAQHYLDDAIRAARRQGTPQ